MLINDFQYEYKHLGGFTWEVFLINSENVKFGGQIQMPHPPPKEMVFQAFQQNPKQFFIEVKCEKIY